MDKRKDWTEQIKQLPDWVKGAIGLITMIIGFIVLFQDNTNLSIIVSLSVTLISAFCFSVYLAFSKKESGIIGGGRVYRFPSYRGWALVAMIVIPIAAIILLVSRPLMLATFFSNPGNKGANLVSTVPCSVSLKIPTTLPATPIPDDRLQIESLIKAEAEAVVNLDLDHLMTLFREDTVIIDATGKAWTGCNSIKDRYRSFINTGDIGNPSSSVEDYSDFYGFISLEHHIKKIEIDQDRATVESSATGEYMVQNPQIPWSQKFVSLETEERWRLVKDQGSWWVINLTYNYPLLDK